MTTGLFYIGKCAFYSIAFCLTDKGIEPRKSLILQIQDMYLHLGRGRDWAAVSFGFLCFAFDDNGISVSDDLGSKLEKMQMCFLKSFLMWVSVMLVKKQVKYC